MKSKPTLSVNTYLKRYDKLKSVMNWGFSPRDEKALTPARKAAITKSWNSHGWLAQARANRGITGKGSDFDLIKVDTRSKAGKRLAKMYGNLKTNKGYWIRKPKLRKGYVQEVGLDSKGNVFRKIGRFKTVSIPIELGPLVSNPKKYLKRITKGYRIKSIRWVVSGSTANTTYGSLEAFIQFLNDFYIEMIEDGKFTPTGIEIITTPNAKKKTTKTKSRPAQRKRKNSRK